MKAKAKGRQKANILPFLNEYRNGNGRKKTNGRLNQYLCSLEKNQAGKFAVRIRARFARRNWTLSAYLLASSIDQSTRKLEQAIRFMQASEERLWFWGVDRSDDPGFAADLLGKEGLKLDRRAEFPARSSMIRLAPDRPVGADVLLQVRRDFSQMREVVRVASD